MRVVALLRPYRTRLIAMMTATLLAACATPGSYVYVANADSREVQVSRLDGDGTLTRLQSIPVAGSAMPMALSPDKRFLFVSLRTAPFRVATLGIDRQTGTLTPVGEYPLPDNMANIATDRTGRWLFGASYGGNKLSVSRIGANGSVAAAQQLIATKPMAHSIQPTPDNRHVLATSLGGDEIMQFAFNAESGKLEPASPASIALPEKSGPRHLAFHPDGKFVYLIDELDAGLKVFSLDAARGTLTLVESDTALPPGFTGQPWGADLHLTPDGRFLYTSDRGSDTLGAFSRGCGKRYADAHRSLPDRDPTARVQHRPQRTLSARRRPEVGQSYCLCHRRRDGDAARTGQVPDRQESELGGDDRHTLTAG